MRLSRHIEAALAEARQLGHLLDGFELDAYDPDDTSSKPDSVAARCAICEEILALDMEEKPYRFGRGWVARCGEALAEAA